MKITQLTAAVRQALGARLLRALATPPLTYVSIQQRFNAERAALRAAKRLAGGQRQWKRARRRI